MSTTVSAVNALSGSLSSSCLIWCKRERSTVSLSRTSAVTPEKKKNIEVEYYLERVFPLYNVRFVSINDGYDSAQLQGNTGGLSVAFKYLIAELYSRDLSIKYKSAKYMKFKRGEYQSKICPYGFRKSSDGRMVPDGEAADIIRLIFGLTQNVLGRSRLSGSCTSAGPISLTKAQFPHL